MYWNHGGGTVPTEFEFGTELIVSPVLEPADQAAGRAKAEVWLQSANGSTSSTEDVT